MSENDSVFTFSELVDELRRCYVEKVTGTVMAATQDNQLARILFEKGNITFLSYGLKNGLDAVTPIKGIKEARVKISQGRVGGQQGGSLPSTAEILQLLSGEEMAPSTAQPASTSLSGDQIPNALKVIEAELIEFLGPVAQIVWSETLEQVGKPTGTRGVSSLVDALAKEVRDPVKVQRFKSQVWEKIGGRLKSTEVIKRCRHRLPPLYSGITARPSRYRSGGPD